MRRRYVKDPAVLSAAAAHSTKRLINSLRERADAMEIHGQEAQRLANHYRLEARRLENLLEDNKNS